MIPAVRKQPHLRPELFFLLILLPLLCLPLAASSANPYAFNFDTEDGLPSMEVYDLEFLDDQTVWFATDRGVCRYDGFEFETLTQKEGLLHDCVLRLNKDPWGRIWMTGLDKRLCVYDGKSIEEYAWNDVLLQLIHPGTWVEDLAWDEDGNLIIMNSVWDQLHVSRIDQASGEVEELNAADEPGQKVFVQASGNTFVDLQGQLIPDFPVSTSSGINTAEPWIYYVNKLAPEQLARMTLADSSTIEVRDFEVRIFDVTYGSDGVLYLGTSDGLYSFSEGDMYRTPEHAFAGIAISRMCEDETGGFWLTTIEKGIFYVPSMGFRSDWRWDEVLANETVISIQKGPAALFIATKEGNVYTLDTAQKLQHLLTIERFLGAVEVLNVGPTAVMMGPYRLLWEKGGFRLCEQFVEGLVAASLELKDGTIFVAGYKGWEIRNAAEDTVLSSWSNQQMGRVQALQEREDQILIGAANGLYTVDKASGAVEIVKTDQTTFNYRVSDIEVDRWGNCWVATLGNGLFYLHGSEMHQVGQAEGLRSANVNRIVFDGQGRLWMATNFGIQRLAYRYEQGQLNLMEIKALTGLNGLPSNYVRDVSYWQGEIYLASDHGIHRFDPALPDRELPIPKVQLRQLLINGNPIELTETLQLQGPVDQWEIHFSAYSALKSKQQPLFRSRLLGPNRDTTWTYSNASLQRYRNLEPGEYRLEVEACNARGEWANQPTVLVAEIQRAWGKPLTLLGLLLFTGMLIGGGVWRRKKTKVDSALPASISPESEEPATGLRFDLEQRQLVLPTGQGYRVIQMGQIHYIEANGSYVLLHLEGEKQHVLSQSLTAMEEMLPAETFFRIHKSFLLNCEMVEGYESGRGGKIFLREGRHVPVAVRRKAAFIQKMKNKGIKKIPVHKK